MAKKKSVQNQTEVINWIRLYHYFLKFILLFNKLNHFRIKNKFWYFFQFSLFIFLFVFFNSLLPKQIIFLNKNFIYCLPTLNYYLISLILANLTFMFYQKKQWYEFLQVLLKTIALAFWFVVYKIYPFTIGISGNDYWFRLIIKLIIVINFFQLISFIFANLHNLHLIRTKRKAFIIND